MRAGASGFLLKDAPPGRTSCTAVRAVARGEALLAPALTGRLLERFVARPVALEASPALEQLGAASWCPATSGRGPVERRDRRLADHREATVKTHVARVLRKLSLRDRVQAVVFASERTDHAALRLVGRVEDNQQHARWSRSRKNVATIHGTRIVVGTTQDAFFSLRLHRLPAERPLDRQWAGVDARSR